MYTYIHIGLHLSFSQFLIKQNNEVLWQTTVKKTRSRLQAGENHRHETAQSQAEQSQIKVQLSASLNS